MSFRKVKIEDKLGTVNVELFTFVLSQHKMFCVTGHVAGAEA